jgi:hypothetical protein
MGFLFLFLNLIGQTMHCPPQLFKKNALFALIIKKKNTSFVDPESSYCGQKTGFFFVLPKKIILFYLLNKKHEQGNTVLHLASWKKTKPGNKFFSYLFPL